MTEEATVLESADIHKIMALLPHRYPFLMVDRIVDIEGDKRAVGIKNVTANEPHFLGHFPSAPVMPGVLIHRGHGADRRRHLHVATGGGTPQLVYFMTIDNAKFRKPVVPGDRLEYHVTQTKKRGNIWKFDCIAQGRRGQGRRGDRQRDVGRRANRLIMAETTIHPTAVVEDGASIGDGCEIGPFCHVGPQVALGANSRLRSHVRHLGQHGDRRGRPDLAVRLARPCPAASEIPRRGHQAGDRPQLPHPRACDDESPARCRDAPRRPIGDNCAFFTGAHVAHDCIARPQCHA